MLLSSCLISLFCTARRTPRLTGGVKEASEFTDGSIQIGTEENRNGT